MKITHVTGNLTRDVELREFDKASVSRFHLAVNHGKETLFLAVEAWNQDHLARYLRKGSKALVSGSLKQENWETNKGEKRSRVVLKASQVEFLDPKDNNGSPRD